MSVTALELVQRVAAELGFSEPSTLEGTTNQTVARIKACVNATGKNMRKRHKWPILMREYVVTLPQNTTFFLPPDMSSWIGFTVWDRTNQERIRSISAQDWQYRLGSAFDSSLHPEIRERGYVRHERRNTGPINRETYTQAEPPHKVLQAMLMNGLDSSTASVSFEYITKSWLHPQLVEDGADYQKGDIVAGAQYHEVVHQLFIADSNFSNQTLPDDLTVANLVTGVVGDDWKIWGMSSQDEAENSDATFFPYTYDYIRKNEDAILLDEDAIVAGAKYRFRELQGQPYAEFKQEYELELDNAANRAGIPRVISSTGRRMPIANIPEGSWDL